MIAPAAPVELPTYAFQHQHYWAKPPASVPGDLKSAGLDSVGHPLLGAAVELAGGGGLVCTGRLSLRDQPWLGDHAVGGVVLLPGTAFMELAVVAGYQAGCPSVEELTLAAPLVVPSQGALQVQVTVGGPDPAGRRAVEVHARPDSAAAGQDAPWTRHAVGALVPAPATASGFAAGEFSVWPPPDADPVDVSGVYDSLAAVGYGYGPAFQGLRAAWRRGDDIFAEVELPPDAAAEAGQFGVHPALLDAALHTASLAANSGSELGELESGDVMLPFAWADTVVYAVGSSVLRARLSAAPGGKLSLVAADASGAPVISVGSLLSRQVASRPLGRQATMVRDALFRVTWVPVTADALPAAAPVRLNEECSADRAVVLGPDPLNLAAGLAAVSATVRTQPGLAELIEAVRAGEPVPDVVLASAVSFGPSTRPGADAGPPGAPRGW